jgi:hypothetical protein
MARGWESKSVEAQQDDASRARRSPTGPITLSEAERVKRGKRRTLELARTRAAQDLERATAAPHRRMLEQALKALDDQLATFD